MKIQIPTTQVDTFEEMALAPELMTALEKINVTKPTAIQAQAIPLIIEGSDMIGVAQTGSGKTLAFALSTLTRLANKPTSRTLILAPSREMAQQIHKVMTELCIDLEISTCLAIGGIPSDKQTKQLKKNPRVVIATPGRMNDHLVNNKLLLQNVETVIIDEADRMLDMGFAPQLKNIQRTLRGTWQTLMFSASFSKAVESIAEVFMKESVYMVRAGKTEIPVTTLKQKVLFLDRDMKNDRLLDELNATKGGVIVFTGSQERCEEVGGYLESYGFSSDIVHGNLSQGQRNRVVREFREGKLRIVVATDLLARGIDIPHVDHVVNLDLPFQAEDFLHRIGRTARAGREGNAITFVTPTDKKMYDKIEKYLKGSEDVMVDPYFAFIDRSQKYDGEQKPSKFKSSVTAPKRIEKSGEKPRNDKYAHKKKTAVTEDDFKKRPSMRSGKFSGKPASRSGGFSKRK